MSKELTVLEAYTNVRTMGTFYSGDLCIYLKSLTTIETALKDYEEIDDVLKDYNFERDDIINAIGLYRYFLDNKIDLMKVDDILTNNKEMLCYEKEN